MELAIILQRANRPPNWWELVSTHIANRYGRPRTVGYETGNDPLGFVMRMLPADMGDTYRFLFEIPRHEVLDMVSNAALSTRIHPLFQYVSKRVAHVLNTNPASKEALTDAGLRVKSAFVAGILKERNRIPLSTDAADTELRVFYQTNRNQGEPLDRVSNIKAAAGTILLGMLWYQRWVIELVGLADHIFHDEEAPLRFEGVTPSVRPVPGARILDVSPEKDLFEDSTEEEEPEEEPLLTRTSPTSIVPAPATSTPPSAAGESPASLVTPGPVTTIKIEPETIDLRTPAPPRRERIKLGTPIIEEEEEEMPRPASPPLPLAEERRRLVQQLQAGSLRNVYNAQIALGAEKDLAWLESAIRAEQYRHQLYREPPGTVSLQQLQNALLTCEYNTGILLLVESRIMTSYDTQLRGISPLYPRLETALKRLKALRGDRGWFYNGIEIYRPAPLSI